MNHLKYIKTKKIGNVDVDYFDLKTFKNKNLTYKKDYINAISEEICEDLEMYFHSLKEAGNSPAEIREFIFHRVSIMDIICLVDFINPFPITSRLAKRFSECGMFLSNIKYSTKQTELLSDFRHDKDYYQNFDWYKAIDNNYKFIITYE